MSSRLTVSGFLAVLLLSSHPIHAAASGPEGTWLSGERNSKILIESCASGLCGKVIYIEDPAKRGRLDVHNPDPSLRSRPLLGMTIMHSLKPEDGRPNQWRGHVYNPRDGKTYDVFIRPKGVSMEVEGCLLKIFCKTQIWQRVTDTTAAGSG